MIHTHKVLIGILLALSGVTPHPTTQRDAIAIRNDETYSIDWAAATQKAQSAVAQMSIEEKVNMTRGTENPLCSGNLKGITRLNIPDICFLDGASGLHIGYLQTQYPSENGVAATWNRQLTTRRAVAMGEEFRKAGVHNALGPVAGPLGYTPYGGRNWENFSPDPYLTGQMASAGVRGIQSVGVGAVAKHFVGNEQEYLRSGTPGQPNVAGPQSQIINDDIPDDVLHETLILPFAEMIRAGLGGVMCSYNRINETLACDSPTLRGILRDELAFQGFQISDWGAARNAFPSTNSGGTDINMPGGGIPVPGLDPWGDGVLVQAVKNGTVTEQRLDEQVTRALIPYYALGQDNQTFPSSNLSRVVFADDSQVAYDIAKESITMVKNAEGSRGLPLRSPRSLGLFGDAALDPVGLLHFVGQEGPINEMPTGYRTSGGGASLALPPWIYTPLEAFTDRARKDKFYLDHFTSTNVTFGAQVGSFGAGTAFPIDGVLSRVESAMVFVTAYSSEGYDRETLKVDNGGDELIRYIAAKCDNTIVVVNSAGPVDVSGWIGNDNVTSVLFHYFPGQDGGRALVPIVFGDESPSGKLPFTVAKRPEDYDSSVYFTGNATLEAPTVNMTNLIDYRFFDYFNVTPEFEFGFGMTFSTFDLGQLEVKACGSGAEHPIARTNELLLDSDANLYDQAYKADVDITNTGKTTACQVIQLYVSGPGYGENLRPVKVLRGFEKICLEAGQTKRAEMYLVNKDLATWNSARQGWEVKTGEHVVQVGFSSRQLISKASIERQ